MNPKISIIIPVYNNEKYLEACLNTISNQTIKNIEIICINDGSTDNSLNILNSYAQKDSRFKVLSQDNKGQSSARNLGMTIAKGEYMGFMDSDDWAKTDAFEKMYFNAKKFNADISMCAVTTYNEKTFVTNHEDPYTSLNIFPDSFQNRIFSFEETYNFIFRICVSPLNKIYRRKYLEDKKIKFKEGLFFEDNLFFYETFMQTKKCCLLKENLITYRLNSANSTCAKDEKKLDFFKVFEYMEAFLKEKSFYEHLKDYYELHKKNTFNYWLDKIQDEKIKQEYELKLKQLEAANQ